jgi:hypothetical protein
VIPLVVRLQKAFQGWAQPGLGPFRFDYNNDRIDALSSERAAEWRRIGSERFATDKTISPNRTAQFGRQPQRISCPKL